MIVASKLRGPLYDSMGLQDASRTELHIVASDGERAYVDAFAQAGAGRNNGMWVNITLHADLGVFTIDCLAHQLCFRGDLAINQCFSGQLAE